MVNYYELEAIPLILKRFKINNIIITGELDKNTFNQVLKYCNKNQVPYTNLNQNPETESPLTLLPTLKNYNCIFLNDDPNWYTIYNELETIKKTNEEFPLVFICNNTFPHVRRDSYINPKIIPNEFRHESSKSLNYNGIKIDDDFYHAIKENTSKNGVLTAIEDFMKKYPAIGMVKFKLTNGITILYPKHNISKIRLSLLSDEIKDLKIEPENFSDNIIERDILIQHISRNGNVQNEKLDNLIHDYENQIKLHNDEIEYKNSQIEGYDSKINLKDSQIKNIESKLVNKEHYINNLNNEIKNANTLITSLQSEINKNKREYNNKELTYTNQISLANSEINSLKSDISQKTKIENDLKNKLKNANNQIKNKEKELNQTGTELKFIKHQYTKQLSKLENKEYCISCYQEEINNNHLEIEYLKKESFLKKILSPFSYLVLIFKSKPSELSLNLKLYKALKNSKCFDIGFYLKNNSDILEGKWCKYFSPELHYICNGFDEKRKFNKKYFNRKSKSLLLDYLLKCEN